MNSPQWYRDEEFRQSVIRKALLLGFEATETQIAIITASNGMTYDTMQYELRWQFSIGDKTYGHYTSIYSAAYEFLRLHGMPLEVIGDYRG